jgi:single-strand DNA-binding protein
MYKKMIIVGRLGRDPEMRFTPQGTPQLGFSIATDRKYKDQSGQQVTETIWFRVTMFGQKVEKFNTVLKKGFLVLLEGRLNPDKNGNPRAYINQQDNTPRASYDFTAFDLIVLSARDSEMDPNDEDAGDYGKIIVTGTLEGDPEIKYTASNTPQAVFRLVSVRNYSNQTTGQTMSETTRYTVSVFGKRAEVVQNYLKNGSRVLVEGRLSVDNRTGGPRAPESGEAASFDLIANDFAFLPAREGSSRPIEPTSPESDDVPF